jgi:transcriptional regulator
LSLVVVQLAGGTAWRIPGHTGSAGFQPLDVGGVGNDSLSRRHQSATIGHHTTFSHEFEVPESPPMYLPAAFAETSLPVMQDAIRNTGLATLVTMGKTDLTATHLPLLLDPDEGPCGTLYGHLSRGNPQCRDLQPDVQALAIFLGPDAYVSPGWYASKGQSGRVVPTWNYITVHAYGPLEVFDDSGRLLDIVDRLTKRHEAGQPSPWRVSDAPEPFVRAQLKGILGVRLPIARIEGKWKLSQNRNGEDRAGVADGLASSSEPQDRLVSALMRA